MTNTKEDEDFLKNRIEKRGYTPYKVIGRGTYASVFDCDLHNGTKVVVRASIVKDYRFFYCDTASWTNSVNLHHSLSKQRTETGNEVTPRLVDWWSESIKGMKLFFIVMEKWDMTLFDFIQEVKLASIPENQKILISVATIRKIWDVLNVLVKSRITHYDCGFSNFVVRKISKFVVSVAVIDYDYASQYEKDGTRNLITSFHIRSSPTFIPLSDSARAKHEINFLYEKDWPEICPYFLPTPAEQAVIKAYSDVDLWLGEKK